MYELNPYMCLFVNSGTERRERQQGKEQEFLDMTVNSVSVDTGVSRTHTVIKGSELHTCANTVRTECTLRLALKGLMCR